MVRSAAAAAAAVAVATAQRGKGAFLLPPASAHPLARPHALGTASRMFARADAYRASALAQFPARQVLWNFCRCALPARRACFGAAKPRRQRGRSWNPSFTLSPRLSVADWPLPPRPADCRTPAAPAARRLRRRRHGVLSIFDLSIYAMR